MKLLTTKGAKAVQILGMQIINAQWFHRLNGYWSQLSLTALLDV